MDADMPYAEQQSSCKHPDDFAVDAEQKERQDGQRCPGNWNAKKACIEIFYSLFAAKIAHPIGFIEQHEQKRGGEPRFQADQGFRL